jgi:hypothetical protein
MLSDVADVIMELMLFNRMVRMELTVHPLFITAGIQSFIWLL